MLSRDHLLTPVHVRKLQEICLLRRSEIQVIWHRGRIVVDWRMLHQGVLLFLLIGCVLCGFLVCLILLLLRLLSVTYSVRLHRHLELFLSAWAVANTMLKCTLGNRCLKEHEGTWRRHGDAGGWIVASEARKAVAR